MAKQLQSIYGEDKIVSNKVFIFFSLEYILSLIGAHVSFCQLNCCRVENLLI